MTFAYLSIGLIVLAAAVLPWLRISGLKDEVRRLGTARDVEADRADAAELQRNQFKLNSETKDAEIDDLKRQRADLARKLGDPGDVWDTLVRVADTD